ncbi:hypothetical protein [Gemmatimonas aurantiaca]|uniref:hypothetical protein n=1 Tax=Gemmatimonas aurantiaca TaxID=173480 RepID=UPI00301E34D9
MRFASILLVTQVLPYTLLAQSIRPALTAARESPPGSFGTIVAVRELSDTRLLVVDQAEPQVHLATGAKSPVGRAGRGPGEYTRVQKLVALGGDSTWFEDPQARRWHLFAGITGLTSVDLRDITPRGLPRLLGADRSGRVLYSLSSGRYRQTPGIPRVESGLTAESLTVFVRARDPRQYNRFPMAAQTVAGLKGMNALQTQAYRPVLPNGAPILWQLVSPLATAEQSLLFADGWIVIAYLDPYRVDWISPQGHRTAGAPLPFTPVRTSNALRQRMVKAHWPEVSPPFSEKDLPPWPDVLPPFRPDALIAAPDGSLLIQRVVDPASNTTVYDIIDRSGKLLRQLRLPAAERIVGSGARHIYIVARDDDELERLRQVRWPMP